MGLKSILLPDLGEGVTEGEIIKIKVSPGEAISMDQALLEVMTDKASMEIPSSIEGILQDIKISEGDIVSVGAELFTVKTEGSEETKSEKQNTEAKSEKPGKEIKSPEDSLKSQKESLPPQSSPNSILASPSTRKLAKDLRVSLKAVQGTGKEGEIQREDLLRHIKSHLQSPQKQGIPSEESSFSLPKETEVERKEPVRGIKRLMFKSMSLSKATIPHFTIGEQAQVEYLVKLKTETNAQLEKHKIKTGYLPFFIKALLPVLKEFPVFNSVYSPETNELLFKKDLNIGFAVDSPQGLLVPVLKKAQNKSLLEIIKEIRQLAEQSRQGQIAREQLTGASITISNLGSLGGFYGTPIINPPEMAIMGVYRLFHQLVPEPQGGYKEKAFMNFSITCDHRFIDGATSARFLKSFVSKIEEPSLLLLD